MKKLFLIFCSFLFSFVYSQKATNYIFNVELSDRNQAPTFTLYNGILIYEGTNSAEKAFFAKYKITKFYPTYPNYKSAKLLNMYTFETVSSNLMGDLITKFPSKYLRIENLTGLKIELLYYPDYYPDDYGTTSPVTNLGNPNISLISFDYVNVPKAWGYFLENNIGNVTIGISDVKVNNSDEDLMDKVTYLNESLFSNAFSCVSDFYWHGTAVGSIAAAQGNNAHGMTGVCPDCEILNVPYFIDSNNTTGFTGLMNLANVGVRVINMSWYISTNDCGYCSDPTYTLGYAQSKQEAINELHDMGVVLVAGAGNAPQYVFSTASYYSLYVWPASYDHVISVTTVQSKNANFSDEVAFVDGHFVSYSNQDIITPHGSYDGGVYEPYWVGNTTNTRVDICGPGSAPLYSSFLLGCSDLYGSGTSMSAPFVSGTVALMQSLNSCLNPDEVEDVLQLCSKNIEANPYNSMYIGRIGSGKLETGDAVEFIHEMMSTNGNALIDGQDFWRFDFNLSHIFNKLTISNQIFRDGNTSNFTAKNVIDVTQNSDFRPNANGFVDLNIDSTVVVCDSLQTKAVNTIKPEKPKIITNSVKLFPNPNKGTFTIMLNQKEVKNLSITVFDVFGKLVFETTTNDTVFDISIPNLSTGLYLVKLSSDSINETLKFVKD